MGQGYYLKNSRFRQVVGRVIRESDNLLAPFTASQLTVSIDAQLFEVSDLIKSHPSLFLLQYSAATYLIEQGIGPTDCMGISLGELLSCAITSRISLIDACKLVSFQASIVKSRVRKGGMAAVFGESPLKDWDTVLKGLGELVSVNYDGCCVVAYTDEMRLPLFSRLEKDGYSIFQLPIDFPFHSKWIDEIKEDYMKFCSNVRLLRPLIRHHSTVLHTGKNQLDFAAYLWSIIREGFDFSNIAMMLDSQQRCLFIDFSPDMSLASILRKVLPRNSDSKVVSFFSPYDKLREEASEIFNFKRHFICNYLT